MTRATQTQFTKAITRATIQRLGEKIAARAIASSSAGKAIMRSVKRLMIVAVSPPA